MSIGSFVLSLHLCTYIVTTGQHGSSSFMLVTVSIAHSYTQTTEWFCPFFVLTALPSFGWCPLQRWRWSWCRWQWLSRRRQQAGSRWWWWWWAGPGSRGLQSPTCFSSSGPLLTTVNIGEEWVMWAQEWNHRQGCVALCWGQAWHHLT